MHPQQFISQRKHSWTPARDLLGTITSLQFSRSGVFELDRRTVWRRSALCHRACQEETGLPWKTGPPSRLGLITAWEKAKDLFDWEENKKKKEQGKKRKANGSEKHQSHCVLNKMPDYHGNSWCGCNFFVSPGFASGHVHRSKRKMCVGWRSTSAVVIWLRRLDAALVYVAECSAMVVDVSTCDVIR